MAAIAVHDTPAEPHTTEGSLLEAEGLSRRFGGLQALDDVTFRVQQGSVTGLMGPNGAGKTTLLNIISGFETADRGSLRLGGRNLLSLPPDRRAETGLGRTFQQVGLVRSMTVGENLVAAQFGRTRYGLLSGVFGSPAARQFERLAKRRAEHLLEIIGLRSARDTLLSSLSYGQLKMVEVAAVLCMAPSFLMLDEPAAGLAHDEAEGLGKALVALRDITGTTLLVVEHNVRLMLEICDYIYMLNFGKMLAEGTSEEIAANPQVAEAYFGEAPRTSATDDSDATGDDAHG